VFCPVRLPSDIFDELHFLPDPVFNKDAGKFKPFKEIYGVPTTDKDRPAAKSLVNKTAADITNNKLFNAGENSLKYKWPVKFWRNHLDFDLF
jgi:hypothetical protein